MQTLIRTTNLLNSKKRIDEVTLQDIEKLKDWITTQDDDTMIIMGGGGGGDGQEVDPSNLLQEMNKTWQALVGQHFECSVETESGTTIKQSYKASMAYEKATNVDPTTDAKLHHMIF